LTFPDHALERLVDAFDPILVFPIMDRQFFGDDVCATRNVSGVGGIQKNGLAYMEFVVRHDVFARGGPKITAREPKEDEAKIAGGD
jgi:hypothetical protein